MSFLSGLLFYTSFNIFIKILPVPLNFDKIHMWNIYYICLKLMYFSGGVIYVNIEKYMTDVVIHY